MNDRKAGRQAIATFLETNTNLEEVYSSFPADFGRLSPVVMVESDGTATGPARTLGAYHRKQAYIISLWCKRSTTSEDALDDLSGEIVTIIENNGGHTTNWESLELDEGYTQTDKVIVDGIQYRVERIRVIVW